MGMKAVLSRPKPATPPAPICVGTTASALPRRLSCAGTNALALLRW
jgi:hypothetical protein